MRAAVVYLAGTAIGFCVGTYVGTATNATFLNPNTMFNVIALPEGSGIPMLAIATAINAAVLLYVWRRHPLHN